MTQHPTSLLPTLLLFAASCGTAPAPATPAPRCDTAHPGVCLAQAAAAEATDPALAREKYQLACVGDRAEACIALARLHQLGEGGERSREDAARYLNAACELGRTAACADRDTLLARWVNSLACESERTCAATRSGALFCWEPGAVQDAERLGTDVASVALARDNGCLVDAVSTVRCWGSQAYSLLGLTHDDDASVPVAVMVDAELSQARCNGGTCHYWSGGRALDGASAVAIESQLACAVRTDGLWCWGERLSKGKADDAADSARRAPRTIPGQGDATAVALAGDRACAVDANGALRCWSWRERHTHGVRAAKLIDLPERVAHVAMAETWTCAAPRVGTVTCWQGAQQGDRVDIAGLEGLRDLSGSAAMPTEVRDYEGHRTPDAWFCGLKGDGSAWCFAPGAPAQKVEGVTEATAIAVGPEHACAIVSEGALSCWPRDEKVLFAVAPGLALSASAVSVPR